MRGQIVPKNLQLTVPPGPAATRETLKHMRDLVRRAKCNFAWRDLANRINGNVPAKDWPGELAALFDFVQQRIRYSLDPNDLETIQSPGVTMALGYGDCDDMAILLATLLECAGHPCCFMALGFQEPGEFSHVIVICSPAGEGDWVALDATESNPPGWFPPGSTCDMVAPITPAAYSLIAGQQ